ncbi:MAG: hypothetical protein R3280_04615 [Marinobacter sp.]|uniref:hypothetical protein n=1 Tax=Marinobacter sp. TaxID=50741 RepID=UPI00299DAD8E|nr:hypothetical protein [Marinobacter sp.]MDX1633895.1 hypothetical protein [Marinobacter sp.]
MLVVGLVAGLAGCANRVTVPDQPPSATRAFLVNHGRHASLVLPAQDEGWLRYSHGEWRWYALNEKGVWRALQAILWPTRAAIGRGRLAGPPQDNRPVPGIPEGYVEATGFAVPASRVAALRRRLDGYFETADTRKFQPLYQLEFVPYPKDYWFMHQSNEVMANWLRALGLEVTGPTLFSEWQFR